MEEPQIALPVWPDRTVLMVHLVSSLLLDTTGSLSFHLFRSHPSLHLTDRLLLGNKKTTKQQNNKTTKQQNNKTTKQQHNSDFGATGPTRCSATSFTDQPGQASCTECGPNTFATFDNTGCVEVCTFQPDIDNEPNLVYDLSALQKDDMYGPIYDYAHNDEQVYFLNMCSKQHRNHSCLDGEGQPIPSYACQITNHGYGVDLGHLIGFIPNQDGLSLSLL